MVTYCDIFEICGCMGHMGKHGNIWGCDGDLLGYSGMYGNIWGCDGDLLGHIGMYYQVYAHG